MGIDDTYVDPSDGERKRKHNICYKFWHEPDVEVDAETGEVLYETWTEEVHLRYEDGERKGQPTGEVKLVERMQPVKKSIFHEEKEIVAIVDPVTGEEREMERTVMETVVDPVTGGETQQPKGWKEVVHKRDPVTGEKLNQIYEFDSQVTNGVMEIVLESYKQWVDCYRELIADTDVLFPVMGPGAGLKELADPQVLN